MKKAQHLFCAFVSWFVVLTTVSHAASPSWWTDSSAPVLDSGASHDASGNYAPANLGQLKNVAKKARLHLEAHLPEGAGSDIETLVNDFEPRSGQGYTQAQIDAFIAENYAPINLGQLKAVAKFFYERLQVFDYDTGANLVAHGYPTNQVFGGYPWNPATPKADNYAPANLGQLKMVFSFDLSAPAGELPGWWVAHYYPNPTGILPGSDSDNDGLTNLQEYEQKSDPTNYYSQGSATIVPVITIAGGNNQTGAPDAYVANPLQVEVRNSSGNAPLNNAPVVFSVTTGGGFSVTAGNPTTSSPLTVRTDSNGIAGIYFKQGAGVQVSSIVTAQAGSGSVVTFASQTTGEALSGQWKFNEGSGNTADDDSIYGNDGTLTNSPQWVTRTGGQSAINFTGAVTEGGTNSYVTMGNPGNRSLDFGSNSFSIALWVKFTEVSVLVGSNGRRILGKGLHEYDSGYTISIDGTGQLWTGIGASTSNKADALFFRTTNSFNDGQWHLVMTVIDRENATAQIYVDGVAQDLVKESGTGGTIDPENSTAISYPDLTYLTATRLDTPLIVGSRQGALDFFKGSIDDLQIFRKALTPEEIAGFDYDSDGLPDDWEMAIVNADLTDDLNSVADVEPNGNLDGDSLTNLEEWQLGLDPLDSSDAQGYLEIVSGSEQSADSGQIVAMEVRAMDFLDRPMVGRDIRIRVGGEGLVRPTGSGPFANSVELTTDAQGGVAIDCQVSSIAGSVTKVLFEAPFAPILEARLYIKGWLGIWGFDDGEGTQGRDSSSFQRSALLNGTTWITGKIKSAIHFTAASKNSATIESTANTLDLGGGSFTGMAWIKTSQTGIARILGQGFYDEVPGFALEIGVGGAGRVSFVIGEPAGDNLRLTTTQSFNDGGWHHIALVVDRVAGTVSIYVDGALSSVQEGTIPTGTAVTSATIPPTIWSGNGEALILGWALGSPTYFDGDLDEARLYRGVLSGTEIATYSVEQIDSDADGMPDSWEQQIVDADSSDAIEGVNDVLPGDDFDQDGISNLDEYIAGTSSIDYYNGTQPIIVIDDGNSQSGSSGVLLVNPIRIRVMDSIGRQLNNAPLFVQPNDPSANVGSTSGTLSGTIQTRTTGDTKIYVKP